jgi:hypothetical protein
VKITDTNLTGLEQLCGEFGFSDFAGKLSEFRPSMSFKETEDAKARGRIAALEEKKADQHDHAIAVLQDELKQFSTDFRRLADEVSTLRSVCNRKCGPLSDEVSVLKTEICCGSSRTVCGTSFDEVRRPAKKKF